MSYEKENIVVNTAKVGCCYAQYDHTNREVWDVRRIKINHNFGDAQHGAETVHNHNCVTGAEREALKFSKCYSPHCLIALKSLKKLYPDNAEYREAYQIAYAKAHVELEEDRPYPPCVFAVLDTWFEYSDIKISDKFSKLKNAMLDFEEKLHSKTKDLNTWVLKEISDKRKKLNNESLIANPSNATRAEDVKTESQSKSDMEEEFRLIEIRKKVPPLYKERINLIDQVQDYWDNILVFAEGYQSELAELSNAVAAYVWKWKNLLNEAGIDTTNEKFTSFSDTFYAISNDAATIGRNMVNWETEEDYALLTSSFLICKCGGKIEFLSSGQEHYLYCGKLFAQFVVLLRNSVSYFQELLDKNCVYNVTPEESDKSVNSAIKSLQNIISAFEISGRDFLLDEDTKAVEIRFITKGYNKEKAKKQAALIGMFVLTPIAVAGGAAGGGAGAAVSAGLWIYDAVGIGTQDPEDGIENTGGDLVTIGNDTVSVASGIATWTYGNTLSWRRSPMTNTLISWGNPTVVISFLNSLSGLFYSSEDDWIEEIEITVFTPYLAHIIKEAYDREVNEVKPFDGKEMVRAKSKVEYSCESLKTINWDELDGVLVAVDKDFSFGNQEAESKSAANPQEVIEELENNTSGELKR